MPTTILRTYHCKDVEVLTVSSEIVSVAQANLGAIIAKRPLWANPYFTDLKTRIDNAFVNFIGVDNAADLRAKTQLLYAIMHPAQDDLGSFKINIEADF